MSVQLKHTQRQRFLVTSSDPRLMNQLRSAPPGQRFEDAWAKDRSAEAQRRMRNEQVWTGTRR